MTTNQLPVMDYKNKSIPLESITSFDVNKAIQRSLTKACARHGLGLYIYAGEDLPEGEAPQEADVTCERCGKKITPLVKRDGSTWHVESMAKYSKSKFGAALCGECMKAVQKQQA